MCERDFINTQPLSSFYLFALSLFFQCMIIVCCCCHSALLHWSSADVSLECYSHNPSLLDGTLQYRYWLHNRASASYAVFTMMSIILQFTKHKTDRQELYFVFTCYNTWNNTKLHTKMQQNIKRYQKKSAEEKKHNKSNF